MPSLPTYNKCRQLGCQNPRSKYNSYCLDHGGSDTPPYNPKWNANRTYSNDLYKTQQWQTLRQIQLSTEPLCAACKAEGIITAATVVDHLFPWTHIGKQAFYLNKFQSLCATHHATKGQLERRGIYRQFGQPHVDYTKDDYWGVIGEEQCNT